MIDMLTKIVMYLFRESRWKFSVPGLLAGIVLSFIVVHYIMIPFDFWARWIARGEIEQNVTESFDYAKQLKPTQNKLDELESEKKNLNDEIKTLLNEQSSLRTTVGSMKATIEDQKSSIKDYEEKLQNSNTFIANQKEDFARISNLFEEKENEHANTDRLLKAKERELEALRTALQEKADEIESLNLQLVSQTGESTAIDPTQLRAPDLIESVNLIAFLDPQGKGVDLVGGEILWEKLGRDHQLELAFEVFYKYRDVVPRRNRIIERIRAESSQLCEEFKTSITQLDDVTRQKLSPHVIAAGIDARRAEKLDEIRLKQERSNYDFLTPAENINRYSIEAAISDLVDYHNQCSLLAGLEAAGAAPMFD